MTRRSKFDYRWAGVSLPEDQWHFHRQLLKRYGIVLEPGEFAEIMRDIRKGYALLVERRGNRAIYSIRLSRRGERIFVLTDGNRVFTAWPHSKRLNAKRREAASRAAAEREANYRARGEDVDEE